MRRGRIWLLANQGAMGGGEVMLERLAGVLRELDRSVTVVAPAEPAEVADRLESLGFPVERIPGQGRAAYLRALRGWHRRTRPRGILWCNGLLPAVALSGVTRRIVHLHQLPQGPMQAQLARVARRGALVTAVPSRFLAERMPGARVLPNWTPDLDGLGARSQRRGRFWVGYLGRISEDKGVHHLLQAMPEVEREQPGRMRLLLAGEPRFVDEAQAQRLQEQIALTPGAESMGWQDPVEFLSGLDLLVVPSVWPESFGLVAAEAMSAQVPVLVTDTGALPEVVGEDHPLIVPAQDPHALAQAVLGADRDPELAAVAAAGRRRWEAHWSPEAGRTAVAEILAECEHMHLHS